jgi:hypothetical protein
MKIFKLVDIPDLKKPVAPNEFLARAKYERETSLVVKFENRFPADIVMPHEPKELLHNKRLEGERKFLIDLTWSDWELLKIALERTIKKEMTKRADMRWQRERDLDAYNDNKVIVQELFESRFRIFMTWLARFKMEKKFHEMGIKSLDDFKLAMNKFHDKADHSHRVLIELFLRQFGLDPNITPTPIQMERLSGKDELLARLKVEDDRTRLINLDEARLKMAQINAATQIKHHIQIHDQFKSWKESLHEGPTETEKKIKGIKG